MKFKTIICTSAATISLALAFALPAHAAGVSGQGTWETTLLGRDINRNAVAATDSSAVYLYDTVQHITWLRDANVNGLMDWNSAMNWAANLSTGSDSNTINDWRLPLVGGVVRYDIDGLSNDFGYNVDTTSSEMASLWYGSLGNKAYCASGNGIWSTCTEQPGWGLSNTGYFKNLQSSRYWFGTDQSEIGYAWSFRTSDGLQENNDFGFGIRADNSKRNALFAMAVRPGDVLLAPVPEPETYAMLLAGLGVMGAVARRRKAKQA